MIHVTDPIVRHAIQDAGADPDALEELINDEDDHAWRYDCYNGFGQIYLKGPATSFQVGVIKIMQDGFVMIRWIRPSDGMAIRYELNAEGGIITVEKTELSETVLQGASGQPLMNIVGVPGGETMRVITAVNSKAFVSDPVDLRIQVEPA